MVDQKEKSHNLMELYGRESSLAKYRRITVGRYASWLELLFIEILFGVCVWLPGLVGFAMRKLFYPMIFGRLPFSVNINKNVTFRAPKQIYVGVGVSFDEYCQVQAISKTRRAIDLGKGSVIHSFSVLNSGEPDGFIVLGENCTVGQGSILYGNGGLRIGNNVLIAGHCFMVASSHNFGVAHLPIAEQGITTRGIVIEDGVWIGAGVKILDGVTIGSNSIIGANSVVTTSIPSGVIAVGAPCRVVKPIAPTGD